MSPHASTKKRKHFETVQHPDAEASKRRGSADSIMSTQHVDAHSNESLDTGAPLRKSSPHDDPPDAPSARQLPVLDEELDAQESATTDNFKRRNRPTKTSNSGYTRQHRFIVFIGNLPPDTTTDALRKHFAAIHPDAIRHITHKLDQVAKGEGKSKGFAFLEFTSYDRMRTCLKLYQRSLFTANDSSSKKGRGKTKVKAPKGTGANNVTEDRGPDDRSSRRINVELTAGGGGTSKGRKQRLRSKNEKLSAERARRSRSQREEQEKKKKKKETENENVDTKKAKGSQNRGDVHPSRRSRIES